MRARFAGATCFSGGEVPLGVTQKLFHASAFAPLRVALFRSARADLSRCTAAQLPPQILAETLSLSLLSLENLRIIIPSDTLHARTGGIYLCTHRHECSCVILEARVRTLVALRNTALICFPIYSWYPEGPTRRKYVNPTAK